jgi:hypothetical protein
MVRVNYYKSWVTPVVTAADEDLAGLGFDFKSVFSVPALSALSTFGFDYAGSDFASTLTALSALPFALDASACCGLLSA